MPPKGAKPTNDELLAQFDDLGIDNPSTTADQTVPAQTTSTAATTGKSFSSESAQKKAAVDEKDPLAELENLASQRPSTPRLSAETRRSRPSSGRTSEDKPATSQPRAATVEDEQSSARTAATTATTATVVPPTATTTKSTGGGWWGGLLSTATATATAAMKQAEAAVKEIQKNEEAQKWAEQVRGNVGALRGLGGELRTLALPTFTSIIHTLAPPISSHERLQIHVTHDLSGYPSLEPIIHSIFARVMSQVEGGELLVIQRGQESSPRRGTDFGFPSSSGWRDGPWWRTVDVGSPRSISAVPGVVPGTKLARASAEAYATDFYGSRGGIEEAAKQATAVLSESNPVRSSDIFLAVQAISQIAPTDLFKPGPAAEKGESDATKATAASGGVVEVAEEGDEEILFAIYLHDPVHGITFHTISQTIPRKWIEWLDASGPIIEGVEEQGTALAGVPEEIRYIIESGGVDPREWVSEWVEEALTLSTGIVAQRYVARRMGVGEGAIAKGKLKAEQATSIEAGAGEAARTLI